MAVTNIVDLIFRVSDQASGPARSIEERMGRVQASMEGVRSAGYAIGGAMTVIGGGLVYAAKKAVDLGQTFENTSLSIAGNIQAFGLRRTFEQAKVAGVATLERLDEMAAKLPGTTEEYVEIFKTVLPAAISGGMRDLDQVAEFTSKYAAVAKTQMVDATTAGSELSMILTGAAGQHVTMWRKLKPLIKMNAEEFNHLSDAARLEKVRKALEGYNDAVAATGETLDAKFGELEARIVKIARVGGQPIFDETVRLLGLANEYLRDNELMIRVTVKSLAEKLVKGFRAFVPEAKKAFDAIVKAVQDIKDAIGWVMDHADGLKLALEGALTLWLMASTYDGIKAIADLFVVMRDAALVIEGTSLAGAVGAGAGAAGAGAGLAGLTGKTAVMGLIGSIGKTLLSATSLAAGSFAYMMHGNLAEDEFSFAKYYGGMQEQTKQFLEMYGTKSPFERFNELWAQQAESPKGGVGIHFHNARFDIKQAFAEGYDPDRIATAFVEQIGSTTMYMGQSQFATPAVGQ